MAFAAVLGLLALAVAGSDADAGSISILRSFGTIEIQRAGATTWIAGNERMRLRSGDKLRTGARAWCFLELSQRNVVKVMERTRLNLEGISTSSERVAGRTLFSWRGTGAFDLRLVEGQVVPVLDRFSGSSMNLATPVAVAGVRGTAFSATVELVEGVAADAGAGAGGGMEAAGAASNGTQAGATYNVDVTVYHGLVEVTDLRSPEAGSTFVPAGYSLGFTQVNVPAGGFSRPQGGPGAGGGQQGGRGQQPGGLDGRGGPGGGREGQGGPEGQSGGREGQPGGREGQPGGREGQPGGNRQGPGGGAPNGGTPNGGAGAPGPRNGAPGGTLTNGGAGAAGGAMTGPRTPGPGGTMTQSAPSGPLAGTVRAIGPNLPGGPNVGGGAPRAPLGANTAAGSVPGALRVGVPGAMPGGPAPTGIRPPPPPPDGTTTLIQDPNRNLVPPPTTTTTTTTNTTSP